jgi:hypothetical protein
MKYRPLPPLQLPVSALGFGVMRLPLRDVSQQQVDEEQSIAMLRHAVDKGINYIDTAYPYHGGASEVILGRALRGDYRQRVFIADKLPVWQVRQRSDVRRFLETQLQRLQDDYIDLYLLHALNAERWELSRRLAILSELERAVDEGLIGHIGFSFHDEYAVFERILQEYDGWEFCQIQYNFMDIDYQAGRRGLQRAAEKGLGVVVMEPLKGGMLAGSPPPSVAAAWESAPVPLDPVATAFRWLWDHEAVGTVLSGMSTPAQLEENLSTAEQYGRPGNLSPEEVQTVAKVRAAYNALNLVDCTSCGYCLPCPEGVSIPRILQLYNDVHRYGDQSQPARVYSYVMEDEERADNCTACGQCESVCPQQLPIVTSLQQAHAQLTG